MNFKEHIGVGLIASISIAIILWKTLGWYSGLKPLTLLIYVLIIIIYSILPDIDHPISKITWWTIGISIIGILLGLFYDKSYLYPSVIILAGVFIATQVSHHRGVIHSIPLAITFSFPIYFSLGLEVGILALVAYYSHLAADGLYFKLI